MSVIFAATCDGQTLSESNPLDLGPVVAGGSSQVKTITVKNTGTSDALQVYVEPIEAIISNGFSANIQTGTALETYASHRFAPTVDGPFTYTKAYLGVGKNFANGTAGNLANTNGSDSFAMVYTPPSVGVTGGDKMCGHRIVCFYAG